MKIIKQNSTITRQWLKKSKRFLRIYAENLSPHLSMFQHSNNVDTFQIFNKHKNPLFIFSRIVETEKKKGKKFYLVLWNYFSNSPLFENSETLTAVIHFDTPSNITNRLFSTRSQPVETKKEELYPYYLLNYSLIHIFHKIATSQIKLSNYISRLLPSRRFPNFFQTTIIRQSPTIAMSMPTS